MPSESTDFADALDPIQDVVLQNGRLQRDNDQLQALLDHPTLQPPLGDYTHVVVETAGRKHRLLAWCTQDQAESVADLCRLEPEKTPRLGKQPRQRIPGNHAGLGGNRGLRCPAGICIRDVHLHQEPRTV